MLADDDDRLVIWGRHLTAYEMGCCPGGVGAVGVARYTIP